MERIAPTTAAQTPRPTNSTPTLVKIGGRYDEHDVPFVRLTRTVQTGFGIGIGIWLAMVALSIPLAILLLMIGVLG